MQLQVIQNLIYEIRGQNVMLDFDIAELYSVETRVLIRLLKEIKIVSPKILCFSLTKKSLIT
jgi:hypothetical protein